MYFKITAVNNQYFWQLLKSDGTNVSQAPHIYPNLDDAKADIDLIKKWAVGATITEPELGVGMFGGRP